MDRLPAPSLLDTGDLPVGDIATLAKREGARPRPAYQAHKWFARRFAVNARSLLTAAVTPADAPFWPAYYGEASCAHVIRPRSLHGRGGHGAGSCSSRRRHPGRRRGARGGGRRALSRPSVGPPGPHTTHGAHAREGWIASRQFYQSRDEQGVDETLLHAFWIQVITCARCGHRFDAHPTLSPRVGCARRPAVGRVPDLQPDPRGNVHSHTAAMRVRHVHCSGEWTEHIRHNVLPTLWPPRATDRCGGAHGHASCIPAVRRGDTAGRGRAPMADDMPPHQDRFCLRPGVLRSGACCTAPVVC